jgi:hypothetical protein
MLQFIVLPYNYSFCPFSSTPFSPSDFTFPTLPSPACHPTTSTYSTLTTHLLAYCANCTYSHPSAIPETSTLHNTRTTPLHMQGSKNAIAPTPLSPPPHPPLKPPLLVPPFQITHESISTQTSINTPTPIPTVYRYNHHGVLYIICKQLFWN